MLVLESNDILDLRELRSHPWIILIPIGMESGQSPQTFLVAAIIDEPTANSVSLIRDSGERPYRGLSGNKRMNVANSPAGTIWRPRLTLHWLVSLMGKPV
jgi:hypothetical protein